MKKINTKEKIYIPILLLAVTTVLYFYNILAQKTLAKCPESYPETDKGFREQKVDTDKWVGDFEAKNPSASLSDLAKARFRFYVENDCAATIQKYSEMKESETETEQEKVMREMIQEEIRNQSMENLIEELKK